MTATENFEMNEGVSKVLSADDTTDEDSGGTLDMSGYSSLTWYLKTERGGDILVEKSESGSSDVTVTDETIGAYEIRIAPSDTDGITTKAEDVFFHKVRLVDSSGETTDLVEGHVTIREA